jgi:hypothetical protein
MAKKSGPATTKGVWMMRITRSLVAAGFCVVLVFVAASWSKSQSAAAAPKNQDTRPAFYLTQTAHMGNDALNACAAGYHMASQFEIANPSNLRYETTLGQTTDDSGFGLPALSFGWIRTGGPAETLLGVGVLPNCNAWQSASGSDAGTYGFFLPAGFFPDRVSPTFAANAANCDGVIAVWCIQD